MKISKKILPIILISTMILSVGCVKPGTTTSTTLENTVIQKTKENKYEIQTSEFDLGNEKYIANSNKEMPYKVRGIISVPKGNGKFPIVLIAHGSHENIEEGKRFDTGFKYLGEELAKNGYIAVSMDLGNAYIWKYGDNDDAQKVTAMTDKHLEYLKKANNDNIKSYKIDLKNKINFDKLALIGYSRGGESIFRIANEQEQKGQKVSALLPIAPTARILDTPYLETDIPTSIIVPEYDGDVSDLSGFHIYDVLNSKKRDNFLQVTMLKKANHNYFNESVLPNDATMTRIDVRDQLTRNQQEDFLVNYTVDFLDSVIKNKDNIYNKDMVSTTNMYGYDVKTIYSDKNNKKIVAIDEDANFKEHNVYACTTQDSWFYKDDKAQGIETITQGDKNFKIRKMLNVKWDEPNGSVSFEPNTKNFKKYKSFSMNVLQDPSDKLNPKGKNQAFTIEIKDRQGNISRVELNDNINALEYIDGKLMPIEIDGKTYVNWSCNTPITQVRIPIKEFKGVDLNNIKEVSLVFDKTKSGSIMISSFELN